MDKNFQIPQSAVEQDQSHLQIIYPTKNYCLFAYTNIPSIYYSDTHTINILLQKNIEYNQKKTMKKT